MYKRQAQLAILCYIYGSRVVDIFEMRPRDLRPARQEFQTINFKKGNLMKRENMPRTRVYTASVFEEENTAWRKIWNDFGFNNPNQPLLFMEEAGNGKWKCRWASADIAVRALQRRCKVLGLCYEPMQGGQADITGHSFRRSRGIHLSVSYTHLRAHETREDLVCRLLLEKKKKRK